ncbi:MAG: hypothetical protein LQ351_003094 [Letrouitia transgressa]|nr:MAG: hypothetical protein LQ351_003094 [Letrouitia transgressa]
MALVATAEGAREVAICLDKFLEHLPEISTEITALISECYAISSALRELNTAKEDPRYSRRYNNVHQDVQIVCRSLEYTFHDVHRLFGGLGRSALSTRAAYSSVWRDIDDHFWNEKLVCILVDGRPRSPLTFEELQARTDTLLEIQDEKLEATFNNLSLSDPDNDLLKGEGLQVFFLRLLTLRHWFDRKDEDLDPSHRFPPPWIKIFRGLHRRQSSACHGPDLPGASSRLADEYTKLLDM